MTKEEALKYLKDFKDYENLWDEVPEDALDIAIKALEQEPNKDIDNFVDFLITENCEGCTECDPRLEDFACCEAGRAKWFLKMAEKFKSEVRIRNDRSSEIHKRIKKMRERA